MNRELFARRMTALGAALADAGFNRDEAAEKLPLAVAAAEGSDSADAQLLQLLYVNAAVGRAWPAMRRSLGLR